MVNTFVVSSDFTECAAVLDNKRLGKQRVEALQILDIILKLRVIALHYSLKKCPEVIDFSGSVSSSVSSVISRFLEICEWVDYVLDFYENMSPKKYLARINGKLIEIDELLPVFRDVKSLEKNGDKIIISGKSYDRNSVVVTSLGDTLFSLGFSHHPIVKMWVGYENALRYYTNCCISEWVERGYVNTMKISSIKSSSSSSSSSSSATSSIILPWWVYSPQVILAYKSNLIRKDAKFYGSKFPDIVGNLPYIWPSMLEKKELEALLLFK